jgi:uncharacterized phage infection (PIP) family protein YhgE
MSRKSELQEKFEIALKKGLESESAVERTAAIKATADMLNPNLGELQTQVKQAQDRLDEAKNSLKEITAERDTLAAKAAELQPLADRIPAVELELADMRTNFDARIAEARKELVSEAQQERFKAERAERAANTKMAEAESRFGQAGLQLLLDQVKKIVEQAHIPEPDWASLPAGISPLFLTLWGYTPTRARIALGYAQSYKEPTEGFRQQLLRVMLASLPTYEGAPSETIADRDIKQAVLTAMAQKWNVLTGVQKEFEQIQSQRQGEFIRHNTMMLAAQQSDLAVQGYGRDPIRVEPEQSSVTGYSGPHDENCVCGRPGCKPLPAHLRPYEIEESL